MSVASLRTTDLKLTALLLALGHRFTGRSFTTSGQVEFGFSGVPSSLLDDLANDRLTVSARRFLEALETVHTVVGQARRERAR